MNEKEPPFHTDELTIKLIQLIPGLRDQVIESLRYESSFMDDLGVVVREEMNPEKIEIKHWAKNQIISVLRFSDESVLAQLSYQLSQAVPASMIHTFISQNCSKVLGYPIFSEYRWKENFDETDMSLDIDIESNINLGNYPIHELSYLTATATKLKEPA